MSGHRHDAADKQAAKDRARQGFTGMAHGAEPKQAAVIHRSLMARELDFSGVTRMLDCIAFPDGRMLTVFGKGTQPTAFAPDGAPGCATPTELREIFDATLVMTAQRAPLALKSGQRLVLTPHSAEPELFAGLNTIFGFRTDESAAQVAEGLHYHATHHGLQAALIVTRLPDGAAFAEALRQALGTSPLTVVVLDSPIPLGKPDEGPANHPWFAPDAPGKDRMAVPSPDPWRSALSEHIVIEALKWRFLSRARAVLFLDVSDVLAPNGPNAFDQCHTARQGVVLLAGRRTYPWRVRSKDAPGFGDHICRQFDSRQGMARWGVAPAKAGLEKTWRMARIAFAKPDSAQAIPFYRAMAIRVPAHHAEPLAPKTSLVEDPALLTMADQFFRHVPVRAPTSRPRSAPKPAAEAGRTAIVTTMKNEGPFILEWIAYHRAIGVNDFLIYTNDCTDGTDKLLDLLQARGLCQHRVNPWIPGGALKPQHAALQAAESEPVMQQCDWGICMDVDEFITIKIGDGTLRALYAALGEANMISLTWRLFGSSDVSHYQDHLVVEQFTRCAPEVIRKPHQAWGFKTLFRNIDLYKKLGVHRPKGLKPDLWTHIKWLNGSGKPMPKEMFRNGWRSTLDTYGYDWVQLNHYAVRSAESFLVKRDRGRVNHVDRDQGLAYWFRMNHNFTQDTSIQRMLPAIKAEYARLLADPEIRALHDHAVACHRAKIAELLEADRHRSFFRELTSPRMQKLCRLQHHFGSAVFAAGPSVIPPDLHARDLPPDFFFTVEPSDEANT